MINLKHDKCIIEGCDILPTYGKEESKKLLYCSDHGKEIEGMIPIGHKKCLNKNCNKRAIFGYKNDNKLLYCGECALNEMINLGIKRCDNCNSRALYGLPVHTINKCNTHKEVNMIIYPNKKCECCKNIGTYQDYKFNKRYCKEHKNNDSINIAIKICNRCKLPDILNKDKLCVSCDPNMIKKVTHAKELEVKALLDNNNIKYESHDKIVDKGVCIKYRPDFIFDANTHYVVLEIDEYQHTSYACECEQIRMINICQALGMPTIFIRYNPDEYINNNGKKCNLKFHKRSEILLNCLNNAIMEISNPLNKNSLCSVIYLYYDNYDGFSNYITLIELEN